VPDINTWAVLVATLSTLVVGSIWWTKRVFGSYRIRVARVDEEAAAKRGAWPVVVTALVSFTALVLAGAIDGPRTGCRPEGGSRSRTSSTTGPSWSTRS
jgi:hypothetical protein